MARLSSRRGSMCARNLRWAFSELALMILLGSPAFAQLGTDRVSQFLSNALSYAQGLGIFGAGFMVIWAVANIARERPSSKQWAGAGGALLLSSVLQLLRTFAG